MEITAAELLQKVERINVWSRGDQRAPHKPLLVLYALGRWLQDPDQAIAYEEADRDLRQLLETFGPPREAQHPEYPFWRLQNDGIWSVSADGPLQARQSNTDIKKSELLQRRARGWFADPVRNALRKDPTLVQRVAESLLDSHFPASIHEDIRTAVALPGGAQPSTEARDASFRTRVLVAYEYRCAISGLDLRLGQGTVGLEAAHIKWHQAGGPALETNGLALSALHHKLFDLGAFTIQPDLTIVASDQAHGTMGLEEVLLRHHGTKLRPPQRPELEPNREYLLWHEREVFRGRPRHLG